MKKVGIVTWYKNGNYGGSLQAYALAETIKKIGWFPEFINYDTSNRYNIRIRDIAFHLLYPKSAKSRDEIYKFVKKQLNESISLCSEEDLQNYSQVYDAVICGSDQIWSLINGIDPYYFLRFVPKYKRIAYAPSIGVETISGHNEKQFGFFVEDMNCLSIREQKGAEIIKKLTNLDVKVVSDPTFLLDRDEWKKRALDSVLKKNNICKEKYILCYFLGDEQKYKKYVDELAAITSLPIVFVSSKRKRFGKKQIVCDPFEFLGVINNAKYVITDSYHGMILSINLNKEVIVFKRFGKDELNNQNSRIENVCQKLCCSQIVQDYTESAHKAFDRIVNYEDINKKILEWRKQSTEYLQKSLQSIDKFTIKD